MIDIIIDTVIDGLKILPFLWAAFLIIELLEHRFSKQTKKIVAKSGRFGPLLGGILGCFPQCGFSVMATNLYATRIITMGTLISVYLSTSDEMLPILLAHGSKMGDIMMLLGIKVVVGIVSGFVIDLLFSKREELHIHELCEDEHCHCEDGIFISSFRHMFHTLVFIMVVSFVLNIVMEYVGIDVLNGIFKSNSFVSPILASLVGLIPNCAASVIITELYLQGVLSLAGAVAGLLTGSGVAILVLFKVNKDKHENMKILVLMYVIGVIGGLILELVGLF